MVIVKLYGGLGNQMYQYAAGKALSLRLSTKLVLDTSWFEEIKGNQDVTQRVYELDGFGIQPTTPNILDRLRLKKAPPLIFTEADLNYQSGFENLQGNVILDGYWQSYKYFQEYAESIRESFSFPTPNSVDNKKLLEAILNGCSVSMHVRRGDYNTKRGKEFHGLLAVDYYKKALKDLDQKVSDFTLYIFSDEIDWCKKTFKFDVPTVFVDSNSPSSGVEDMHLMASCEHNIIANSSFSSWAAWLNRNPGKIVYAPKNWFVEVDAIKDRIPEDWILC